SFAVPATRARFAGAWDAPANAWVGEYRHPAGNSPIRFDRGPVPPLPPLPAVAGLDGRWEGTLQGMPQIVVRIRSEAAGTSAWLDVPTQQATGMPLRSLAREDQHVTFSLPVLQLAFDGELSKESDRLAGTLTQAGQ